MADELRGARVALLEARKSGEMAALVRRYGGQPVSAPAVRETPMDAGAAVTSFLDLLDRGGINIVIFQTGVGARALFREAERLGRLEGLRSGLSRVTTVCRGPKPTAALNEQRIPISLRVPEPHTTAELLDTIKVLGLESSVVAVLHYGERNAALAEGLQRRGAHIEELRLYEWRLPEDTAPLHDLVRAAVAGEIDAIAFTSQVQPRHLFQIAEADGLAAELHATLNDRVIVASVGPTCTAALKALGVTPHVIPEHPKMGHLIASLAQHMAAHRLNPR